MSSVRHQQGSTLIEILIAILVVAVGLIGMAGMLGYSLKGNQSAYLRTQASILANDMAEAMRTQRDKAEDHKFDESCEGESDPKKMGETDEKPCAYRGQWDQRVATYLPGGRALLQYKTEITLR